MSEKKYVLNMLNNFAKPGAIFAMVADSYNIYDFVEMISSDEEIKKKIIEHGKTGGITVIRPDSGDPAVVVPKLLEMLEKGFGTVKNDKGYKVLNYVRLIWGDGINELSIKTIIMRAVSFAGFSADNLAFGMGGALLQIVNRDTQKFAMKCSAAMINGVWVDVFKDPITDSGKKSKKGRFMVIRENGEIKTIPYDETKKDLDIMKVRYADGSRFNEISFSQVRANSEM
jgi:nicotinamide phosphoribosyltransferase